jgi:hypothetical protein
LLLEWYACPLGHLHRILQRPLYEWGNNCTPMRGSTPDVIDRIGRLCGGVCDLLQTLSVDGLATQESFCRGRSDHSRRHRTKGNLDLLAHIGLCP